MLWSWLGYDGYVHLFVFWCIFLLNFENVKCCLFAHLQNNHNYVSLENAEELNIAQLN